MDDDKLEFRAKVTFVVSAICLFVMVIVLALMVVRALMAEAGLPVGWFEYALMAAKISALVMLVTALFFVMPLIIHVFREIF